MARRKLTKDEAIKLAERAEAGEFDENPQAKQAVGEALGEFRNRQAPATDNTINGEEL